MSIFNEPIGTVVECLHAGLSNGFKYSRGDVGIITDRDPMPLVKRIGDDAMLGHVMTSHWRAQRTRL